MNILLLYFAIPIAVIIFSIALLKILKCPALVAAVIFAILLVVAFAVFDATFLVLVIIYTILAYITAIITKLLWELICECRNNRRENCCGNFTNCFCHDTNTISQNTNVVANVQEEPQTTEIPSNTNVQVAATIRPNGRNGNFCGCWRRR